MNLHATHVTNVLIIGCGGAGLRAAIEVSKNNFSVKVLGKRPKNDAHTVLAAGGINASFGNLDSSDNWRYHFLDTYLEGYKLGDPDLIELLAKDSQYHVNELERWGANFEKLENGKFNQRYFGAHTYRRTCFVGDYTGQAILNALLKKTQDLKIPIYDDEYVTELLVEESKCFGAMSFNTKTGARSVHLADAVILCTGGHTRIWKKSSSRKNENTGDGLFLALKAGCDLIDMEMVQFHPTGMLMPEEIAGTLVTEAVRGEGGKLINGLGKRFMVDYDSERMELSTRDIVAIANYTEIIEGRSTPNGGVYLDISHKNKDFILSKIPKIYRQFIEMQMIDISKEPMEVAPTAHYSMGGIKVRAKDHRTNIKGLYAAGEVAGGLHGANRLGGNSLAEILVFGKITGEEAVSYSKNLTNHLRSKDAIEYAHKNINNKIKKGNELAIPLMRELSDLMWEYCGVVKNKHKLEEGSLKLDLLSKRFLDIEVRVEDDNFSDLINTFDLQSSLYTAKCSLLSALYRKESRGAHQRDDFPKLDTNSNFNIKIKLSEENFELDKLPLKEIKNDLEELLINTQQIIDFKDKLLE